MAALLDVAILRASPQRDATSTAPPTTPIGTEPLVEIASHGAAPANAVGCDVTPAASAVDIAPAAAASPATDDITNALTNDRDATSTILRAKCDDIARRIIREGGHIAMAQLAREIGTTAPTLKRLMATPTYRETYNRISDEILGSIDDRIEDERLDNLIRGDLLQRRALTVLNEAMAIARGHMAAVAAGTVVARPQLMKVAVDAAAEVRQVVSARAATGTNGAALNVNITKNQAVIIQGAFRESGVDLSDIIGDLFAAAPVVDTTAARE